MNAPPDTLREILDSDGAAAWQTLAPLIPDGVYLGGGTALAVHLRHRVSRDLDFFFHGGLDLDALVHSLQKAGPFAVSQRAAGTLNGVFSKTLVQFLSAAGQRRLEPTESVAGIEVAGIGDIFAMKLKVIGDRGELRDYFDVMEIEQRAGRTVEEGLGLYMSRYQVQAEDITIPHIVNTLGYLEDVADDEALPVGREEIETYWRRRQPEIARNVARFPPQSA